jgi:hypothetical protein
MDSTVFVAVLLAVSVLILYIGGRYYLREGFQKPQKIEAPSTYDVVAVRSDFAPDQAPTEPILRLDDYEYSMVFRNEGSREAGKREISDAMSRYPLDWSVQPPSSQYFQTRREGFVNQVAAEYGDPNQPPVNTDEFNSISGTKETPADKEAMEEEERKILQMYNPYRQEEEDKKKKDLIHYSLNDAKRLVKKLYSKRGLVADVSVSKQGTNVFEINDVRPKDPVIIWEDEIPQPSRDELRGEEIIEVPQTAGDTAAGLDPFYEPRTRTRMDRHDYTKWTPGLERSFAPTYTAAEWS